MTGYGRDVLKLEDTTISVEIRSVNHRFLDVSMKMPRNFYVIEDKIKSVIQQYFARGKFDLFITIEGKELVKRNLDIDWELLDQYDDAIQQMKSRYHLDDHVVAAMISRMEEVVTIQEIEQETDQIKETIIMSVHNACQKLAEMRDVEGQALKDDIVLRLENMEQIINRLGERRETVIIEYRDRMEKRVKDFFSQHYLDDDSKIYQEIALLAEKGDITEEVTRLHSHVIQFLTTVKQENIVGRKLEFILQEMLRETNTIGSKSNDTYISRWVVTLKTEMEKIKEQIQNIE
ncbi:YicC/YloC family endoribonuclease [Paraliobacillus quinghaiensis]|nr:YicC/YloC family endoribonuclease [Paraliobacillus quinghaiensis]